MQTVLALSGETPASWLLGGFAEIGLVRSEYLFRRAGLYPTDQSAGPVLGEYLTTICSLATAKPVWFRTLEVNTREANTLEGVDEVIWDEPVTMMGLRGVRRHMRHPESLHAELRVLSDVRKHHDNLGIVAPFVTTAEEFAWFREQVAQYVGRDAPVASMIETPASVFTAPEILEAGARHVIVGTNDLSSLLLARSRASSTVTESSPALERALTHVRHTTARAGVTMTVAGYLTPGLLSSAERIGADFAAVHYSDLPRLLDRRLQDLPDVDLVASVKARIRAAILELERTR